MKLQTKLFEGPIIQLAAAINKARALEMAWHQASNIEKVEGGQSNVNMVKGRGSKKPSCGFGQHKSRIIYVSGDETFASSINFNREIRNHKHAF